LKLSDSVVEADEPGLLSFIENGKRAGDPQSSANGFLPPGPLVHKQDIGINLDSERDRLALSWIELPGNEAAFRIKTSTLAGVLAAQSWTGFGANGCLSPARRVEQESSCIAP
jgi:hypothetical protein